MVNCICDQIQSENICRNINHGNKLPNMPGTYQIHNLSINARLKAAKKKQIAQSKCRMLHVLHELRKQRARTPLLFKLTLRSRFTLSRAQSLLSRAISRVWPINT